MALKFFLDDIDITEDLAKQYELPGLSQGVYPSKDRNAFYDLLPCIAAHEELKNNFFNNENAMHTLTVVDETKTEITLRLLLSMKYTSRNS